VLVLSAKGKRHPPDRLWVRAPKTGGSPSPDGLFQRPIYRTSKSPNRPSCIGSLGANLSRTLDSGRCLLLAWKYGQAVPWRRGVDNAIPTAQVRAAEMANHL
jgi:hypothetical protein